MTIFNKKLDTPQLTVEDNFKLLKELDTKVSTEFFNPLTPLVWVYENMLTAINTFINMVMIITDISPETSTTFKRNVETINKKKDKLASEVMDAKFHTLEDIKIVVSTDYSGDYTEYSKFCSQALTTLLGIVTTYTNEFELYLKEIISTAGARQVKTPLTHTSEELIKQLTVIDEALLAFYKGKTQAAFITVKEAFGTQANTAEFFKTISDMSDFTDREILYKLKADTEKLSGLLVTIRDNADAYGLEKAVVKTIVRRLSVAGSLMSMASTFYSEVRGVASNAYLLSEKL